MIWYHPRSPGRGWMTFVNGVHCKRRSCTAPWLLLGFTTITWSSCVWRFSLRIAEIGELRVAKASVASNSWSWDGDTAASSHKSSGKSSLAPMSRGMGSSPTVNGWLLVRPPNGMATHAMQREPSTHWTWNVMVSWVPPICANCCLMHWTRKPRLCPKQINFPLGAGTSEINFFIKLFINLWINLLINRFSFIFLLFFSCLQGGLLSGHLVKLQRWICRGSHFDYTCPGTIPADQRV